jgi:hypothetical protein
LDLDFYKNSTSWGSYFYDAKEDAFRVPVTPLDATHKEWLTFGFDNRLPNSPTAYLHWDNKQVPFKIEVPNITELYVSKMREKLRSSTGFDYRNWSIAAEYCAQHKINLEEALTWADVAMSPAISGVEDFTGLNTKVNVLRAMGREAERIPIMDKAIKIPNTPVDAIHQHARGLLTAGKKEKSNGSFSILCQSIS